MFKALVGKGHPEFSTNRQQDAQEFFLHLINMVEVRAEQMTREDPLPSPPIHLQSLPLPPAPSCLPAPPLNLAVCMHCACPVVAMTPKENSRAKHGPYTEWACCLMKDTPQENAIGILPAYQEDYKHLPTQSRSAVTRPESGRGWVTRKGLRSVPASLCSQAVSLPFPSAASLTPKDPFRPPFQSLATQTSPPASFP